MSKLTKTLATITKQIKWPENKSVGYQPPQRSDKYLNPLLTPPPRSPRTPEDFRHPHKLGHWYSFGFDYTSPVVDRYLMHEWILFFAGGFVISFTFWMYGPDYNLSDWSRREAYLRTHKREALGLPLIDKNVVDPDRIVLPTEEEIGSFNITA